MVANNKNQMFFIYDNSIIVNSCQQPPVRLWHHFGSL